MTVYIVSFVINIVVGVLVFCGAPTGAQWSLRKKFYALFSILQFTFLAGSRAESVGWDTETYFVIFKIIDSSPGLTGAPWIEKGFVALCKGIALLGGDARTLLYVCSFVTVSSCVLFFYKYSNSLLYSMFVFISLPYYYTSFDILRQYLAFSIFLFGYSLVRQRRFFFFTLLIILASFFHKSAVLFIPLYFMYNIKWTHFKILFIIGTSILLYFYLTPMVLWSLNAINSASIYSKIGFWVGEFSGGVKTCVMYFVILVTLWFNLGQCRIKIGNEFFGYAILLSMCALLFVNMRMLTRMMMLCIPFVAVAIPQILLPTPRQVCKQQSPLIVFDKMVFNLIIILICTIYHAFMLITNWQNIVPYKFL
ncbi:MAG: EpsG family protein [Cloacibacillus sp.]